MAGTAGRAIGAVGGTCGAAGGTSGLGLVADSTALGRGLAAGAPMPGAWAVIGAKRDAAGLAEGGGIVATDAVRGCIGMPVTGVANMLLSAAAAAGAGTEAGGSGCEDFGLSRCFTRVMRSCG